MDLLNQGIGGPVTDTRQIAAELARHLRATEAELQRDLEHLLAIGQIKLDSVVELPVIGVATAGPLSLTAEAPQGSVKVDARWVSSRRNCVAIRVSGDSMIDAGIEDGDLLFVRRTHTATPGAVVVVRVGDHAAVKIYQRDGDHVVLVSANPAYAPIVLSQGNQDADGVELIGVVEGLFRAAFSAPDRRETPRRAAGAVGGERASRGSPTASEEMNAAEAYRELKEMLPGQFEEVVFRLGVEPSAISSPYGPQATRATEVVRWAQQDPRRLHSLYELLQKRARCD